MLACLSISHITTSFHLTTTIFLLLLPDRLFLAGDPLLVADNDELTILHDVDVHSPRTDDVVVEDVSHSVIAGATAPGSGKISTGVI